MGKRKLGSRGFVFLIIGGLIFSLLLFGLLEMYSLSEYLLVMIIPIIGSLFFFYCKRMVDNNESQIRTFLYPYRRIIVNIILVSLITLSIYLLFYSKKSNSVFPVFDYYFTIMCRAVGITGLITYSVVLFKMVIPRKKEKEGSIAKVSDSQGVSETVKEQLESIIPKRFNDLSLGKLSYLSQKIDKKGPFYTAPNIFHYQRIFQKGIDNKLFECNSYKTLIKMRYGMNFHEPDFFNWIYKSPNNNQEKNSPAVTDFMIFMQYLADQIEEKQHQLRINLIKDNVKIGNRILKDKKYIKKIDENKECYIYSKIGSDARINRKKESMIKAIFE